MGLALFVNAVRAEVETTYVVYHNRHVKVNFRPSDRSLFRRHFHRLQTSDYYSVVTKETYTTLRNLAHSPDDFAHHLRRTAAAIVMKISYGHEVSDKGDIYVTLADEAMQGLGMAGIFGSFLVDYLPFCKLVARAMINNTDSCSKIRSCTHARRTFQASSVDMAQNDEEHDRPTISGSQGTHGERHCYSVFCAKGTREVRTGCKFGS